MRKLLIGLLLAATAASPALADKGGHGHGDGGGGGGEKHAKGGGHGSWKQGGGNEQDHGGSWKHAPQAWGGREDGRGPDRAWHREARYDAPVRALQADNKRFGKQWKREAKDERRYERAFDRREHFRPVERYVQLAPQRYGTPRPARYITSYGPVYYEVPAQQWSGYEPVQAYTGYGYAPAYSNYGYAPATYGQAGYWPSSNHYSPIDAASQGQGLFGGGNGVVGALLPMLLQSVLGGGVNGIGGLGGLGSLAGLGGLGGVNDYSPDVYPIRQASYAPYSDNNGDFASLLLPSLLGSGSLF